MPFAGYAHPLLVETHEFRPTKIEGNSDHPCSLGATDIFAQASIYNLYDPDRTNVITYKSEARPWGDFLMAMRSRVVYHKANGGTAPHFLPCSPTSPTLRSHLKPLQP